MKKLNQSLKLTVFVFLFTLPFLIGCAETDRVMRFPNLELPESATVSLDVPTGTEFKMLISTDYRKEKSNFGSTVITHEKKKYTPLHRILEKQSILILKNHVFLSI